MAGRKTHQPVVSDAEAQKQQEAARRMRLECMKLAVEMRTGQTGARGITEMADVLVKYAHSGKVEER